MTVAAVGLGLGLALTACGRSEPDLAASTEAAPTPQATATQRVSVETPPTELLDTIDALLDQADADITEAEREAAAGDAASETSDEP